MTDTTPATVPAYCEELTTWPELLWTCNLCGGDVGEAPCPEHAPTAVPGLVLAYCANNPRHNVFVYASELTEEFPVACTACDNIALAETNLRLTHAAHARWRRSRLVRRLLRLATHLCLINGYGTRYNLYCYGCIDLVCLANPITIYRSRRDERALTRALQQAEV